LVELTWDYDELYSCPHTLLLDEISISGSRAYVLLPALNYRISILRRGNVFREVSNIPGDLDATHVVEACRAVSRGVDPRRLEGPLLRAIAHSFFYGGFTIMVDTVEGETIPFLLEMVSPSLHLYYRPAGCGSLGLETWVRFGVFLRSKASSLIQGLCGGEIECDNGVYKVCGSMGEIVVSYKQINIPGYIRIVVDNTPMRHVVKIPG
jgi:hypothetical protein